MAADMFLDIDGVDGESKDNTYSGKIEISSFSWNIRNQGSFGRGSGGGVAKADFDDLTITKLVDSASPTLMLYCANGKHFPKAKIIARKAGGDSPLEYIVINLEKVFVSGYSTGGTNGAVLTEQVKLNFAKVHVDYTPQEEGGGAGAKIPFAWNIAGNTAE